MNSAYFNDNYPLPLGRSFKSVDLQIVNGEIVFSGQQTFNGYINKKSISRYFSGDLAHYDENNKLIFDGRKDNQIQWNGYRIELEEIDLIISKATDGWVKSIYLEEFHKLFVFSEIESSIIKLKISALLPFYYQPTLIYQLLEVPLNNNGKVDYLALKNIAFNLI